MNNLKNDCSYNYLALAGYEVTGPQDPKFLRMLPIYHNPIKHSLISGMVGMPTYLVMVYNWLGNSLNGAVVVGLSKM